MIKKRERLEIIFDILKVIQDKNKDVRPTHILYKSNLSSKMLKEYLNELIKKEFITEKLDNKKKKYYNILDKGLKYLKDYNMIKSFIESYGLN